MTDSHTVVTYTEDMEGWAKFVRTQPVQLKLRGKAEEFVEIAKGIFDGLSHHDDRPPAFYKDSFVIRRIIHTLPGADDLPTWAFEVRNIDPIANLVEFGAHPDGNPDNFVLKYRIFGRTMDVMEEAGRV